jgi:hypothetical protein
MTMPAADRRRWNAPQITGRYGDSIYYAVPTEISVPLIETMRR